MAGTTGLEPATSAVTGQRSNQLSYVPRVNLENPLHAADGSEFRTQSALQPTAFWRGSEGAPRFLQHH